MHENWTMEQLRNIIWLDDPSFTFFQTADRVYVWKTLAQTYNAGCLQLIMKYRGGSAMVLATISCFFFFTDLSLPCKVLTVTASEFGTILGGHVHSLMVILAYTVTVVQDWFSEHESDVSHLP